MVSEKSLNTHFENCKNSKMEETLAFAFLHAIRQQLEGNNQQLIDVNNNLNDDPNNNE